MRGRRYPLFVAATIAAITIGAGIEACRAPTQVTLDVTYTGKCADLGGVAFMIGTEPRATEDRLPSFTTVTTSCTDGTPARIGTLVVTPSDSTSRGAVLVIAGFGKSPAACDPAAGYLDCIVARRSFSFVDHASPTLPIELTPDCRSVSCDVVTSCRRGRCVSSDVSCGDNDCTDVGGGADAGPILPTQDAPLEVSIVSDAPADVAPDAPIGACTQHLQPVQCPAGADAPPGPCLAGEVCCGFACQPQGSAQTCELLGNCPQFHMECAGARNCALGSICCLTSSMGTSCVAGSVCPPIGFATDPQVCEEDCECGALKCGVYRDGFKAVPKRCR